jgi:hypothetical protein
MVAMENLVITLGVGVALITGLFFLIYRITSLRGYQTAGLLFAITMLVFIPYSVLNWAGADVFAIHLALYVIVPYGLGIITTQQEATHGEGQTRSAPLGADDHPVFFGIVATANAILLSVATHGMPSQFIGVLLPQPQSQATEVTSGFPERWRVSASARRPWRPATIDSMREQRTVGWQVHQGWQSRPEVGEPAVFQVRVLDRDGSADLRRGDRG